MDVWFANQYVTSPQDPNSPLLNPANSPDGLKGVAPAFIALAKYDTIRSHGETFAEKLRKDNVTVVVKTYDTWHGFGTLYMLPLFYQLRADILSQLATTK
eukprot:TRINITY_DN2500_c0_g1_i1.p1 TRINITY_DN2500_c0_g1~~TRINITY_DN2500_c0_g1_i1.p1  ORF type:complete len:100 (-),score=14.16 TRINITY_DN2500_c0_g1_i1:144-443(-)